MTHSKLAPALGKSALARSVFATAFAVFGILLSGCTVGASDVEGDSAESTNELRVAPCEGEATAAAENAAPKIDIAIKSKTPTLIDPVIVGDRVLSGGDLVDDGPRPHPWAPPPEETTSGGSSTGTGSADNSQK